MAAGPKPTSSKSPLVGFEADMNKIMNAMLDSSVQELSVVAIVGPRNVGKTYLAKEIYTSAEVQRHFDVHVWLPMARFAYSAIEDMREQLSIEDEADISNFLRGKRYCVVTDDLNVDDDSDGEIWCDILRELPDNNNGSRVLVTRRLFLYRGWWPRWDNSTLPKLQYEVGPRCNKESIEMLLQVVFPKDPWDGCPAGEVDDLAMKFVRKCKGLPWPLRFLGGLLSQLPWKEVLDKIEALQAAGESFVKFAMRYRDLLDYHYEHKAAFLYFLAFPEGAEIHAKSLFRMLEAEDKDLSYQSGKVILKDLAERSMIEVTKRYSDSSIKCCRLHDPFLRLLAIHEAKERRFVRADNSSIVNLFDARVEFSSNMVKLNHKFGGKLMDVAQLADASCIFNFSENFPLESPLMSHRVLKIDDTKNNVDVVREINKRGELKYCDLSNLRFLPPLNELLKMKSLESLTTLDVGGTPIETLPDPINSPNLTTLLLRNTKVHEIPISFKKLKYLDVRDTFVRSLPDSLWNNRQLQSVLASDALQHLNGPPSSADLSSLSVLKTVHVSNKWGKKLPKFKYLKKLGLSYFKNALSPYKALNWDIITGLLSKMRELSSLKIQGSDVPPEIIDLQTCPSYQNNLEKLSVGGSYSLFSLSSIQIPLMLITLTLENFEFEEDPMPTLGKLRFLTTLWLRWLLYSKQDKKMICTNGEFPQLETLQLCHICGLEDWSVEEGSLRKITHVVIERCKALKDLSRPLVVSRGTPLKELHLHAMPPGFTTKFSHLPFVKITGN
ncbi:Disease resistance protein (CC-NBS-LRR class) family [Rhynchospora pubera]|uniref:Disease resistance protein (CC-NBS-LRR class) family n=1 Tax=Rhynchospora pubera TaxID=906938 RepID=A0AAV8GCR5_9POAL|nr:Disease resistance protein (CC-NBS-LRR class) family [Rhynchospora pubera]